VPEALILDGDEADPIAVSDLVRISVIKSKAHVGREEAEAKRKAALEVEPTTAPDPKPEPEPDSSDPDPLGA
jgi:hypothetical protein